MNRRDLVVAIADHTNQDRKTVDAVLGGLVDVVQATIVKGEPVVIPGFAKFTRVDRPARMGRNPATGQPIKIKASRKVRVTPLKGLKEVGAGTVKPPKLMVAKSVVVASGAPGGKVVTARQVTARQVAPGKVIVTKSAAVAKAVPGGKVARKVVTARKAAPARKAVPAAKAPTRRGAPKRA